MPSGRCPGRFARRRTAPVPPSSRRRCGPSVTSCPPALAAAREAAAAFIGVPADSAALVRNVSEGVAVVLAPLERRPGRRGRRQHPRLPDRRVCRPGPRRHACALRPSGSTTTSGRRRRCLCRRGDRPHAPRHRRPHHLAHGPRAPRRRGGSCRRARSRARRRRPRARRAAGARRRGARRRLLGRATSTSGPTRRARRPRCGSPRTTASASGPSSPRGATACPSPQSFDLQGTVDHSAWLAVPDGLAAWRALGGWQPGRAQRRAPAPGSRPRAHGARHAEPARRHTVGALPRGRRPPARGRRHPGGRRGAVAAAVCRGLRRAAGVLRGARATCASPPRRTTTRTTTRASPRRSRLS